MKRLFILLLAIATLASCDRGQEFLDYNGEDRDTFYAAWKSEFIKTRQPGSYDYFDLVVFADDKMYEFGYTKYRDEFYKDGDFIDFDQLPTPKKLKEIQARK